VKKDAIYYHIHQFSSQNRLYDKSSSVLLGLSAGSDSMFLLHFFIYAKERFWIHALRAIYVNHQQRPVEARAEQEFLKAHCQIYGVDFQCLELNERVKANIEYNLRQKRRLLLTKSLVSGERLALAHHLNDSFEWSLRQSLRSSDLFAGLGIPVKNGPIIRPLLCLSKKQISCYKEFYQIPHYEDSSNNDLRFERNYLRHEVIKKLQLRFPNYLKHYVRRQEALLALYHNSKQRSAGQHSIKVGEQSHLLVFKAKDSSFQKKNLLTLELKKLSKYERGSWSEQLDKFLRLLDSPHPKGPLMMSGGLYLYSLGLNHALISKTKLESSLKELRKKYLKA
jgi:tRNA(Ile)-lysidine synthase